MLANQPAKYHLSLVVLGCACLLTGCASRGIVSVADAQIASVPRELNKVTLPDYVIEPPDILIIQAANTLRSPDSSLVPGDRLKIQLKNGLPIDVGIDPETDRLQYDAESQIEIGFKVLAGTYRIGTTGEVDLGPAYGKITVAGMTLADAENAILQHLQTEVGIQSPTLQVMLEDEEMPQPIDGEHLVRPDGRIALGIYGDVYVTGLTLPEARLAVKQLLEANGIQDPKVAVDVAAYNSKLFYIITDGGGFGESVTRLPYTGNETVLDAIAQISGLSEVSSKKIWVARPGNSECEAAQIMEVQWEEIAALGQSTTNYQILPGDRIYIQADKLVAFDNRLEKLLAPVERVLGVSILGFTVARNAKGVYPIKSVGGTGGGGVF